MILELTPIVIVQIIACFLMVFFMGMSMGKERTRSVAKIAWYFFLIIVWICILIR